MTNRSKLAVSTVFAAAVLSLLVILGLAVQAGEARAELVLTGVVTDAVTGKPVAGARVSDDGYGPLSPRGDVTDSRGRYR